MENYSYDNIYQQIPVIAIVGLNETFLDDNSKFPRLKCKTLAQSSNSPLISIKNQLIQHLNEVNNLNAWDSFKNTNGFFHSIFFERDRIIQTRKISIDPNVHSILSPLNPNSTLYPDGIINTQWIQKYSQQIPCAMILFLEIFELNPSELNSVDQLSRRSTLEKENDQILISEILERKKNCQERGIKLAIAIMIKYHETDISKVDERINAIRKACNLDSKNTLFVMPSGGNPIEFINNVKKSIYESSVNFYRELNRRIKKKKSKHISSLSANNLANSQNSLSVSGWNVRYDLKSAFIAEFRQDMDIAIKNYESAYLELREMFTINTDETKKAGVLLPNTKNWEEAKYLADCINIKICQLYFYKELPLSAFTQFQNHIEKYKVLPEYYSEKLNGNVKNRLPHYLLPKTGNGTILYWSWIYIQMKVFAELVEMAQIKLGLEIPYPSLNNKLLNNNNLSSSSLLQIYQSSSATELENNKFIQNTVTDPNLIIQHAGFYYLLTARCFEERFNCYQIMSKIYENQPLNDNKKLILENESKIDHVAFIIELLKKAYEQFKNCKNGRMTLFLAREIARMYEMKGNYEIAIKFYDRISKTYRSEKWNTILTDTLLSIIRCAKEIHLYQTIIESLVELLSGDMSLEFSERIDYQEELFNLISGRKKFQMNEDPLNNRNIHIKLNDINSFVSCKIKFNKSEVFINTPALFQLSINTEDISSPSKPLCFTKILINFNDPNLNICLVNNNEENYSFESVSDGDRFRRIKDKNGLITEWINIKNLEHETVKTNFGSEDFWCKSVNLAMCSNMKKIFEGVIQTDNSIDLKIISVSLIIESTVSNIILTTDNFENEYCIGNTIGSKWLQIVGDEPEKYIPNQNNMNELRIIKRQPELKITTRHDKIKYLGEICQLELEIENVEGDDIHVFLSAMCADCLLTDDVKKTDYPEEQMSERIEYLDIGVIPGNEKMKKLLYIYNNDDIGNKQLRFKIEYCLENSNTKMQLLDTPRYYSVHYEEELEYHISFEIETVVIMQNQYRPFDNRDINEIANGIENNIIENNEEEDEDEEDDEDIIDYCINKNEYYKLEVTLYTNEKCKFDIEKVDLILKKPDIEGIDVSYSAIKDKEMEKENKSWEIGSKANFCFMIKVTSDVSLNNNIIEIGDLLINWRRNQDYQMFKFPTKYNQTYIPLHKLEINIEPLKITASIPSDVYLGEVFTVTYYISNLSLNIEELLVTMNSQESFSYSGYKQATFDLLPLSTHILHYNFYPLTVGKLQIPSLNLSSKTQNINPKIASTQLNYSPPSNDIISSSGTRTYTGTYTTANINITNINTTNNTNNNNNNANTNTTPNTVGTTNPINKSSSGNVNAFNTINTATGTSSSLTTPAGTTSATAVSTSTINKEQSLYVFVKPRLII